MKVFILPFLLLLSIYGCSEKTLFEYTIEEDLPANIPAQLVIPDEIAKIDHLAAKIVGHEEHYPVQIESSNLALFVPRNKIPSGGNIQIISHPGVPTNPVQISQDDGFITGTYGDKVLFKYAIKTRYPPDTLPQYYQRSGFIHPLNSYHGHTLTMDFPRGHVHQHGLFKAWVNTSFRDKKVDFWNQKELLGTVRHKDVLEISNGPVFSSFRTTLQHLAFFESDTLVVIEEVWEFQVYPLDSSYWVEWTSQEKCVTPDPLNINQYHYGGAAFRATDLWNVEKGAYDSLVYVHTNEHKSHLAANHSRPDWVVMYGNFGADQAGLAMMGHPENFRHPQPIRVHSTMPYFCFAPMVTGPFSIEPGESYESKYGILVYDGPPPEKVIHTMREFFHSH